MWIPLPGEDEALEARLPALQHGEQLAAAANGAVEALRGDGGALDGVAAAAASLARVERIDPALDELAGRLSEASALLDDASAEIRVYRDRVEHDSTALDEVMERLGQLTGLIRKYGPDLDSVLAARAEAAERAGRSRAGRRGVRACPGGRGRSSQSADGGRGAARRGPSRGRPGVRRSAGSGRLGSGDVGCVV